VPLPIVPLVLAAVAALVLAGCASDGLTPAQAAKVNGAVITVDSVAGQVNAARAVAESAQGAQGGQTPAKIDGGNLTRQVLDLLITTELVVDGAAHEGVEITDAQVDERIDQLRARVPGGSQGFAAALAREGLTEVILRSQVRQRLAVTAVEQQLVPGPTDAELQAELRHRRGDFLQAKVRHIVVKDEATADQVRAQLAAGGDWKALAAKYSTDDGSKSRGGDLGPLSKGQTVPEFDKTVFALAEQGDCKGKVGDCDSPLSQPVKTPFGWHVLQVTGTVLPSLDQVRAELEGPKLEQQRQDALNAWLKELAVSADVRVNPRFGAWDAARVTVGDRPTAPVTPTTAPRPLVLNPTPEPATP
jgi:parvulin-like peptidyl-prolyl isomerase